MAKKFIEVDGVKGAIRGLNRLNRKVLNRVNRSIHNEGFLLEGEVKDSISGRRAEPKSFDTGNMARMVKTDNTRRLVSVVKGNAKYTIFLERGTTRISPRWHFRNSAARNERKIANSVLRAIKG